MLLVSSIALSLAPSSSQRFAALASMACFALHPLHTSTIELISAREHMLCSLFHLLAIRMLLHSSLSSLLLSCSCAGAALAASPQGLATSAVLTAMHALHAVKTTVTQQGQGRHLAAALLCALPLLVAMYDSGLDACMHAAAAAAHVGSANTVHLLVPLSVCAEGSGDTCAAVLWGLGVATWAYAIVCPL